MRQQHGSNYSRRSHGVKLLRYHMHDWIMIMGLLVLEIILNIIHPFYRFVGRDMMTDLMYPMKSNTVPLWSVPVYAVLLPILIFFVYYIRKQNLNDFHHAVLGLLFSIFITGVITDSIKDGVGRPRPDFYWRCFPDGNATYDPITTDVICHGDPAVIKEGHKSFPSGHTSWSFAGLGFLSWYLAGKINLFDRKGHASKLCIIFLPLLAAALVGVSRVDDYWHHWQDVFAGGLIGMVIATLCYRQFFPAPYDLNGFEPYEYFQFQFTTVARTQDMESSNRQFNTSQDSQVEVVPYTTMNGEQREGSINMATRGNEQFFDIENGRSLSSKVEYKGDVQSLEREAAVGRSSTGRGLYTDRRPSM
ncbi:lipid phosphate phosphatase 2 [Cryptomeria japonica]|uniref:lipid phosphate phosphatase 2 n=1 Tax=Cryptomeria japonica TaxID=3369 RepID=UPI0027D9D9E7|nr:lipid phosphate phosphatase 2 [Cryptomeria japonica]XP_057848963.2 lipid phosphate phosphatase 2 [Cryptomeria japonica]XP_057848964.2 lipid phosphate phosphatase 2 [Cryptomeria japonica]XP_057848965.2 lipid phosphate phosphatase 2 [Cryptomeria japonica]XP_057848967.2 lipid phosphate phosphatase 2 [Cryptomeria japonica]XP_057848969.2 lipid phosphate phosphatase 2 [Cryptomeria japonica]XP_059075523.1 lipid phosphate phosphatase 2 [Cryptomeria japonica]XP_059075524.1 lipid phosphate phosphat